MKALNSIKKLFKAISGIFNDWLTRSAAVVCLLIIILVFTNMNPAIAEAYPLFGTLLFGMVPVLFIAGGVIFIMAIVKFSKNGETNGPV